MDPKLAKLGQKSCPRAGLVRFKGIGPLSFGDLQGVESYILRGLQGFRFRVLGFRSSSAAQTTQNSAADQTIVEAAHNPEEDSHLNPQPQTVNPKPYIDPKQQTLTLDP